MRNILLFIVKYGPFFLFLFFQITCFWLITSYNEKQKSIFINSSNLFSGYINEQSNKVSSFFSLDEENEALRKENAKLLQEILNIRVERSSNQVDTFADKYSIIPSKICAKSLDLRNNHLTLCKGEKDGIKKGMGVIGPNGVLGLVNQTSQNYSSVLSILHSQSRISVSLANQNHHGYLIWDTGDPQYATLHAIRKYAQLNIGDTIVTSGYSTIFPKGIAVGSIADFKIEPGGEMFLTKIKLFEDFNVANEAYVINSIFKTEVDSLTIENE